MQPTNTTSPLLSLNRNKAAKKWLALPPGKFEPINLGGIFTPPAPPGMTRAFRNNRFTVMIYDNRLTTAGSCICALVQRHDDRMIPNHWAEMQKIKNEIFGPETVGIEYYPAESDKIDNKNIYWMWIYPAGVLPLPVWK